MLLQLGVCAASKFQMSSMQEGSHQGHTSNFLLVAPLDWLQDLNGL